ncbi:MAG: beta-galactosidase [Oscillospiraceae bacterium]|nr:beta-galactosidase [Oscillospiraceae bacterium]
MNPKIPMQFPYGAVYFRKSNPPKEDWERDYQKAADDGMNIFRHWFMWGAIEVAPGVYDWDDYDAQLDLAARFGIKTIIAELTSSLPEWMYAAHPELMNVAAGGGAPESLMGVSSATGGFHNELCLNHPEARALARGFLNALAAHYKGHPGLLGYDIWNECNYRHQFCYHEATKDAFRGWLRGKYETLENLGKAWYRYSFTDWSQVQPPPRLEMFPECHDWLMFRKINAYDHMEFKAGCISEMDPDTLISAHGTAQSLDNMAMGGSDDWMAGERCQLYGYTFVPTRKGSAPYKALCAADLTRAGARGKAFWHAEAQGGPLWLQPQLTGRPLADGRVTYAEDVRLWNLTSMAGGARGILYPRWRPLLDGPLFGAFGPYAMDGSDTPRSRMASRVAKWANDPAQKGLMESAPVKGDLGIVVVPESQTATKLLSAFGSEDHYFPIMHGAYKGFFDIGLQADWVHIDDIGAFEKLYLPCPIMLTDAQAEAIARWVEGGGILVSEGCPGYFGDRGKARTVQPGGPLAQVFGAREDVVQFIPDILNEVRAKVLGLDILCGEYMQYYTRGDGARRIDGDGNRCIALQNSFGKGKALLVGTSPSLAYIQTGDAATGDFFKAAADFMGIAPQVALTNPHMIARLSEGIYGKYIWLLNPTDQTQCGEALLPGAAGETLAPQILWIGGLMDSIGEGSFKISLDAKNAIVAKIG